MGRASGKRLTVAEPTRNQGQHEAFSSRCRFEAGCSGKIFRLRLAREHTLSCLAVLFRTVKDYQNHCLKHRLEVGAVDCPDYEMRALDFLTKPSSGSLHECTRRLGDVVRYDSSTDEFAIFSNDGFIRTYMKPTTAWHQLPSNLHYFQRECGRY